MVLGALEGIAKSVSAEMNAAGAAATAKDEMPGDSLLREGVRRWMSEVRRDGSVAVGA